MTAITTTSQPAATDETTVRRFFEAWAAGDVSDLDALVAAEIVLGPIAGLLYAQAVYLGRRGVVAAFGEIAARWERFEVAVEDARPADDGVAAVLRLLVEKRGMSTEMRVPVICRMRDGRISAVVDAE